MSRIIRFVILALLVIAPLGYGAWKNPEHATLDQAARLNAPGHFVKLASGVTHYEIAGPDTGRIVVMVHGFSVPMYIWDSTFHALSEAGYRTVRYDLYGRGLSDRPDGAYDGAFYDTQLDELLTALYITTPVDLMGLSFGGFVTAHFTASHPQRVRTLTLVDPMAAAPALPKLLTTPIIGPWVWQVTRVPTMADNQASDFLHPEHYPDWADKYRPQMQFRGFGRALLRSRIAASSVNFAELFGSVASTRIPVLLVWGKQDQTIPIALAQVIRDNIPNVDYFPVDSAGHLPNIEQAALVNAKIIQFQSFPANPPVSASPVLH